MSNSICRVNGRVMEEVMTENEIKAEYGKWKTKVYGILEEKDEKERALEEFEYIEKHGYEPAAVLFTRVLDAVRKEGLDIKIVTPWALVYRKSVDRSSFCRHLFYLRTKGRMFLSGCRTDVFSLSAETKDPEAMNDLYTHLSSIIAAAAADMGLEWHDKRKSDIPGTGYLRFGFFDVDGPDGRIATFCLDISAEIPHE